MRRDFLRLRPRLRWTFYIVFAILFATGAAWWVAHVWLVAHENALALAPVAPWVLKLHGAAAMAALIVLGVLYPLHIFRGWRARRNRFWGGALVAACAVLIASGYMLYYTGGETVREVARSIHAWLGLGFPVIVVVHIWCGRATRSK